MLTDLPKTTLQFLIALLKHQAKVWLGDDAAGIAAQTLLDEDIQKRLDAWLKEKETTRELLRAAERAQQYLQDPRHCPNEDLRRLFRDLTFGDLPSVQAALAQIPQAMDSSELYEVLLAAFRRDLPHLSPEQQAEGARLYCDALLRAVGSLERFVLPILLQTVLDLKKSQLTADQKLDRIIATLEARTRASPPPSPTRPGDLPLGSYLPLAPNPLFTGREAELQQLAEALLADNRSAVIHPQALIGMGGLGKTQLAVQFAWTYGYRFAGVHWVSAYLPEKGHSTAEDAIKNSIANCGKAMNLQPWPENDLERQVEMTIAEWKQSGPRLVILDNLEDLQATSTWIARLRHTNIRLLITSRQMDWPPALGLYTLPLKTFTPQESLAFLRRYLDESRAHEEELLALHERFGGLPLPLDLAAAYLHHVKGLSVKDYLQQLNLEHPSLKNWRAAYPNATRHDKDVAATFALSWQRVESEAARKLFLLAGYCPPNEPLRQDVLQEAAELDEATYSEALDLLQGLSLLQPGPSLHPLLADFARLQDADQQALFRYARSLAARSYPGHEHGGLYRDPGLVRLVRFSLTDLLRAAALPERDPKERSALCLHLGFLLTHFGDLEGAMKLYQQSLEIDEHLGDLHGKSATLNNMAGIYLTRGNLDEAMRLYQQALEIFEGLGDLKGKSATLHAMAGIYLTRGDLERAMKLYQQALEIEERLGDLKGKAITLGMMGQALWAQGKHGEAIASLWNGLKLLLQLNIEPQTQQAMAAVFADWRSELGAEAFDRLWRQVTGQEVPDWLKEAKQK